MRVNRQKLPSQRAMLPNGTVGYLPGRNNNNNYTGSSKATTGAAQVLLPQGSESVRNGTSSVSLETEDSLTKLLEDKISSYTKNGKASSSSSAQSVDETETDSATVAASANDESSCISLFDISLPSTSSTLIADLMGSTAVDESSNCTTISTTRILRELPVDGKLLETDINDISLSSFLGHLDAVYDNEATHRKKDTDVSYPSSSNILSPV